MSAAANHQEQPDFGPGPYLVGALLCERVLTEKDNVKSLIRLLDKIVVTATGPEAPEVMSPFNHSMTIWVAMKRGSDGRSRRVVVTGVEPPSQVRTVLFDQVVDFSGDIGSGIDVLGNIVLHAEQPGLHWFDVHIDERLITRMPLLVVYQRVSTPAEE
jgi:hypothetical protein